MQSYYAAVSYIDNMIGKLVHQLHLSMIRENTIVILTSDHGAFYRTTYNNTASLIRRYIIDENL